MSQQEKYSIHVVEMARNNGIAEEAKKYSAHFFMFDYFDVLYHRELTDKDKDYEKYLSIRDPFENYQNYKVSYKVLSLYQRYDKLFADPFKPYEGEGLSAAPFIGVIQITLCKENYEESEKSDDIEGFLYDCEKSILNIVQECLDGESCHVGAKQLYRSSTTGDFCLVLRTDSVEMVYKIMLALNDTQYEKGGIRLFTYANVGMECKQKKDGQYCTLNNDFIDKHPNLTFALRFSATAQFKEMLDEYNGQVEEGMFEDDNAKGLFGRYGYLLNINTAQFAEIYPILCEKKLGMPMNHTQGVENQKGRENQEGKENSNIILSLSEFIRNSFAQNINERILVNLSNLNMDSHRDMLLGQADRDKVIIKNKVMFDKIMQLDSWRQYYTEEHREFQELFRCMKEMCKAFLPVGMEKDAFINWVIFWKDMEALCDCINGEMRSYEKMADCSEEELKAYRARLLQHWRANIQAINQYTRLVQNVNYQTYQSPIYEIQTQIDTEKAMVAYREVMENYMSLYSGSAENSTDRKDSIRALIYPEMAEAGVKVGTLFAPRMNTEVIQRAIFCTVPSFEYFGRLYDLLPWLMHESSHQIRILERKVRNKFIAEYVLQEIFKIVIFHMFVSVSEDKMYGQADQWGRELIEDMLEAAIADIFSDEKAYQEDFEQINHRMLKYLDGLFKGGYTFLEEEERNIEYYADIKKKVVKELLDAGRSNNLIDEAYLELIKKINDEKNAVKELQKVVEILLESYRKQLQEELKASEGLEQPLKEDCTLSLKDFMVPIDVLDRRLFRKIEKVKEQLPNGIENKNILRKYCFSVKRLYRIQLKYKNAVRENKDDKDITQFLENVFERYQKRQRQADNSKKEKDFMLVDSSTIFIMRSIGLLDGDKEKFCNIMKTSIREMSMEIMQKVMVFRTRQYRETFADLLMCISLQIGSFGYCRQVLQTISDARIEAKEEMYNSVNNERFRIVTAVLLKAEGVSECEIEEGREGEIYIEGKNLIEQSKVYCKYTLKCIQNSLLENKVFVESEQKQELLDEFLGCINNQLGIYLDNMAKEHYKHTILYALLHEKRDVTLDEAKVFWKRYGSIRADMRDNLHQFKRLEYLCMGLQQILSEGYVVVSKKNFEHMCEIWENTRSQSAKGCKWEDAMPECLTHPKLNVGKFFNEPEQVHTLTKEQKLENTIDFIQNYYYNNRFRVMKKVKAEKNV